MNPESTPSPEELIEEIDLIEKWKKDSSKKTLIELKAKLLRILDTQSKYSQLIDSIEEWKKQIIKTKWVNNLSLLAELIDTIIPAGWIFAWLSVPFTAWDYYFQHSLKNKINDIYNIIENDEKIKLKLKHINPQSNLLILLELFETLFELIYIFRKVSISVLIIKSILIIK